MKILVRVDGTNNFPDHIRKLVAKEAKSGTLAGRISCDHARALTPAFEKAGLPLHKNVLPQVGTRLKDGKKFIMVKLADGRKWTWVDDAVPEIVWKSADDHDNGRKARVIEYELDTDLIEPPDTRKRHDIDPNKNLYPRKPRKSPTRKPHNTYTRKWNTPPDDHLL